MQISIFDMFTVGIGPSSSHTVGPMRAALRFAEHLSRVDPEGRAVRLTVELLGSLGHTGRGHGTDRAVLAGLQGHRPETVDPDRVGPLADAVECDGVVCLPGGLSLQLEPRNDLIFHRKRHLADHPNEMIFTASDGRDDVVFQRTYYSVGGGFVRDQNPEPDQAPGGQGTDPPYPFTTARELLEYCALAGSSIAELMLANERSWRDDAEIHAGLELLWCTMRDCVQRGCTREGELPGGLHVPRRAPRLHRKLEADVREGHDPMLAMDWVNLYALAVSEENAAGGRVVTAPTNGAAGIIPAVLHYYMRFCPDADGRGIHRFLLTAGAIAILYKLNASISGAEVGCQGEVGVACSMAAAGLTEVLGGTPTQVENAAEIGMEHNLGLTCDPVGGLVQVPCIERNAMGANKAINAARLALQGDGAHKISLDRVIETMRRTGADMQSKYKETARGGLAVNIVEC